MSKENEQICGETSNDEPAAASEAVDYISRMPHKLVHHILSFLPFEYYIILGMVSKEWEELLSDAPILLLDEKEIVSKMARKLWDEMHKLNPHLEQRLVAGLVERLSKGRFSDLVNRVISSNSTVKIKYMCLAFKYELGTENAAFMNRWVRFMMTREIEKLELSLLQAPRSFLQTPDYELPCQPFDPKFTSFMLKFCKLKASRFGSFANLKVLYLIEVKILDNRIGQLLSKCRVLEDLQMKRCVVSENFFICNRDLKVKHLELIHCKSATTTNLEIDISVPQLIVLHFKGMHLMRSTLRNSTNLIDCSIHMLMPFIQHSQGNLLAMLMTSLQHSRTLTLNTWCIQVIPLLDDEHRLQLQGSFTNLKKLTLKMGCLKRELPGIIFLLQICPVLETLVLEILYDAKTIEFVTEDELPEIEMQLADVYNFDENEYLKNQNQLIPCLQNKLKDVEIYWFRGRNREMKLVEFLLQKALMLENLVIFNHWVMSLTRPLHELLDLPRASSSVQISIKNTVKLPI